MNATLEPDAIADMITEGIEAVWASAVAATDDADLNDNSDFITAYRRARDACDRLMGCTYLPGTSEAMSRLTRQFGGDAHWKRYCLVGSPRWLFDEIVDRIQRVGGPLAEPLTSAERVSFTAAVVTFWLRPQTAMQEHIVALTHSREQRRVNASDAAQEIDWPRRVALFANFIPHGIIF